MEKFLFASDLDNTLIFSYKHRKENDVCVEYLDGIEQSFMTPLGIELLSAVTRHSRLVPITSRSIAQYQRIHLPGIPAPEYALTTNGAILLKNGKIDRKWQEESFRMIAPWMEEMERMLPVLASIEEVLRYRIIDEMYLFAICDDASKAQKVKTMLEHETTLPIEITGRKVYFFPPSLSKGMALKRLRQLLLPDTVIAAGDSPIDLSMLQEADIAFLPQSIWQFADGLERCFIWNQENEFSEFVLETILSKIIQQKG